MKQNACQNQGKKLGAFLLKHMGIMELFQD